MKSIYFFSLFCFCFFQASAETDTTFFNKDWKKTSRDSASFYRAKPVLKKGIYLITDRYLSGQTQMTGGFSNLDSEIKEGYFVYYDSLGYKENEGTYQNNKRTGIWKFYHKNSSNIRTVENFKNDLGEGEYYRLDSLTGHKIYTGYLSKGKQIGKSTTYFSDGKTIFKESDYKNDTIIKSTTYDSISHKIQNQYYYDIIKDTSFSVKYFNGTKKEFVIMRCSSGNQCQITYYDSLYGRPTTTGQYINKKKTGIWTYYFKGTNFIKSIQTYNKDSLQGWVTNYDTLNGKNFKSEEGNFINGNRDSVWHRYYASGVIKAELNYHQGWYDKDYTTYDSSGNLLSKGTYSVGKKTGDWFFWDKKIHTIIAQKKYQMGKLNGEQRYYYPGGRLKTMEAYSYGKLLWGKSYDKDSVEISYSPSTVNASFPGNLEEYKETYLEYPSSTLIMQEGKVKIGFTVTEDGDIININLQESVGSLWDENSLRFINEMPKWNPAYFNGLPIESRCSLTFLYKRDFKRIKVLVSTDN